MPTMSYGIPKCQICGKKCHVALNYFHKSNYVFQGAQLSQNLDALTAQAPSDFNPNQAQIMDTRATHHMT